MSVLGVRRAASCESHINGAEGGRLPVWHGESPCQKGWKRRDVYTS